MAFVSGLLAIDVHTVVDVAAGEMHADKSPRTARGRVGRTGWLARQVELFARRVVIHGRLHRFTKTSFMSVFLIVLSADLGRQGQLSESALGRDSRRALLRRTCLIA